GFSPVEPWLPISPTFRKTNVAGQRNQPTSLYQLVRRLIHLRRSSPALLFGSYQPIPAENDLLLYARIRGRDRFLVALNFGGKASMLSFTASQRWRRCEPNCSALPHLMVR